MADSASNTWFGAIVTDDIQEVPKIIAKAAQQPAIGTVRSVLDVIQLPTPQREAWRSELHAQVITTQPRAEENTGNWTLADLRKPLGKLDLIAGGAKSEAPEESQRLEALAADLRALGREIEQNSRSGDINAPEGARSRITGNVARIGASLDVMLAGDAMPLREALPEGLRQRFVSPNERYLVMLHPKSDVWEFEPMRRFIEALREVDPHATGVPITHFESLNDMRNAFERMAYLAFVCVAALVWLDFRSIKDVILAMIPLSIALLWTFGLMGLLDIPFNLANFFSVPIILGLGVAGSVQILHRYHEGGSTRLSLGATRRAVVLSSLTTIVGFGALLIAHHRGLRSLGLAMTLGMTACMMASLVILPAMLALLERRGWGSSRERQIHWPSLRE
jgi:predicted RND superfamily exporter protein